MADAKLYEYAIIKQAKKDSKGNVVEKPALLKRGEFVAKDEPQATLLAGREIPQEELEDLERITLAVRPF